MTHRRFLAALLAILVPLALLGAHPATAQEQGDIRVADYNVTELTYPELRDFDVPDPQRIELDNGLVVFLLEDDELPQVNAVAQFGAGSVYEPAEKRGLASITGTVMRSGGTESMSPDSLNTVLENVGATVETGIGETSGSAYMSTLRDNVDTVLPVFAEVLRSPRFAEAKVNVAKQRQKSAISRRNDNPSQIASRELDQLIYGEESPYARSTELYTVDRIQRKDLVDFHGRFLQPSNTIISVWGDFDAEQMEDRIREQFGDWSNDEGFTPPTPPQPTTEREYSVNVVPKSDVTQSTVYMGHAGTLTRDDEDYPAVTVMNEVLSGGFSGRLFQNVRREQGLAYSVYGGYSAGYNRPGRFFAGVGSSSETTVEATEAVMTEVERMRQEAPTEEELNLAKDSYLNSFVFNFDSQREVLSRLMTYEAYDYPSDFLQQTKNAVEEVTAQDVQQAAQEYLYPDQAHILVVGNRANFSDSLATLTRDGTVNVIELSIPSEPPSSEQAAPTAADQEAMQAGQKLMAQAREALGGSAFDNVENMRVVTSQGGNEVTVIVAMPDKVRREVTTAMGPVTVVSNGETATAKTPRGTQSVRPAQVTGQLWRSLPYLMANMGHDDLTLRAQGDTTMSGTTYRRVRVEPPAGTAYTLHLNAETMRPERLTLEQTNPRSGQTVRISQTFKDFREVKGMMLPYTTETKQAMGEKSQTGSATVQTLEINTDLEDGLFTLDASSSEGSASQ